ncbi:zinc finger fyve/phd-type [Holotrichia oblita]|uniref:Zinc finger fyve/phd-type n=1 Tax=Holotrichia oblita TaxID=644536 RepID=A0ACB9SN50_HOLOL|nr:zinc finger fyve/phd-type [Holotrichia oblita]
MNEECGKCTAKIKQNETVIACSGTCKLQYHIRCVDLSSKDFQTLASLTNVKWFCNNCLLLFDKYMDLKNNIDVIASTVKIEMNKIYTAVKSKQSDLETPRRSFAEVAGNTIIIKPKAKQDTKATRSDITKKLNPAELELGITRVRSIREGGLAITCKTEEDTGKIRKEITKKLKNYTVSSRQPRKPCIKILDIAEEIEDEMLIMNITKQNLSVLHEGSDIRVKTIKKMKKPIWQ